MDFSGIKLIVTDMDGTLLNNKGELDPGFHSQLEKILGQGILFAIASGRQYYSLREKFKEMMNGLIFIAENGAIVMEDGEQKHVQPITREKVIEVINKLRAIGGKYIILSGKKAAYIEQTNPEFMDPFLKHYEKYEVVHDLTLVEDDDFLKITICDLSGAEQNCLPHVEPLRQEFQVKLSGEIWIDVTHIEAQKGNALKRVQMIKGITAEETLSFGDYLNDLQMFEHSIYSYAVANAHEEVKNAAKFSTSSNEELGVQKILGELIEGREQLLQKG